MAFCPNCDSLYNITKDVQVSTTKKQVGGAKGKAKKKAVPVKLDDNKQVTTMINKVMDDTFTDAYVPANITYGQIETNVEFQNLTAEEKEKVINTVENNLPKYQKKMFRTAKEIKDPTEEDTTVDKPAYFICRSCKNYEPIKKGTVIFSHTYNTNKSFESTAFNLDFKKMFDHNALRHTKAYICPNKTCVTHKDPKKKDCISFRESTSGFKTIFGCKACKTTW